MLIIVIISINYLYLQVTSSLTGAIAVQDVVYENVDSDVSHLQPSKDFVFRRLVFQRSESLVQSEALLIRDQSSHNPSGGNDRKKSSSSSKSKKKGAKKRNDGISHAFHCTLQFVCSSYAS